MSKKNNYNYNSTSPMPSGANEEYNPYGNDHYWSNDYNFYNDDYSYNNSPRNNYKGKGKNNKGKGKKNSNSKGKGNNNKGQKKGNYKQGNKGQKKGSSLYPTSNYNYSKKTNMQSPVAEDGLDESMNSPNHEQLKDSFSPMDPMNATSSISPISPYDEGRFKKNKNDKNELHDQPPKVEDHGDPLPSSPAISSPLLYYGLRWENMLK